MSTDTDKGAAAPTLTSADLDTLESIARETWRVRSRSTYTDDGATREYTLLVGDNEASFGANGDLLDCIRWMHLQLPALIAAAREVENWKQANHLLAQSRDRHKEAARALRARVEELEARQRWRQMETAPRDGTRVVLRLKDGRSVAAGWLIPCEGSINHANGVTGPWAYSTDWEWHYIQPGDVTHWLPLPPLPETGEVENG